MNSFPKVLSGIVGSFNDESRRNIAIAIYESEEISWSELKRKFQIQNGSLNYHLKALQRAGLIENVLSYEGERERSVYKPTNLLEKTFRAFREIMTPAASNESFTRRLRPALASPWNTYGLLGISQAPHFIFSTGVINGIGNPKSDDRQKKVPKPAGDILVTV